ncbi:MAG: protein kinase, partial [Gemmatimonadetes bacterium]|nr:protein kinase [Gemmatimonadota bacterium]
MMANAPTPLPWADVMLWDRWEEVDGLLERALALDESQRAAFLDTECKDDPTLREQLESLLAAADDGLGDRLSGRLLRAALDGASPGGPALPPPASDLLGVSVGPYRLERVVGVGGMGAVYLAERADGAFEREVAVKVLHGTQGAMVDLTERFKVERQILASLVHPGIAQLLDGGVMEDGRPYLVMEYVDGAPIDVYCSDGRLDLDARVRLIVAVAKAVEFAHRHMVVHRDLKPNNVLVATDGRVKLLDFGIAKLLDPADEMPSGQITQAGFRFATPGYAAPEQLLGERVSTQTDVYSLSAVLYELLCGEVPYARRPSDSVLERVVEGFEPTAPSAVVASKAHQGVDDPPAGADRSIEKRLAGDLDAILLRGLRARPEERYESVAAFREDLERYLSGRPVRAREGALLYRARKFARRNLLSVIAAGGMFFLITGSAVGLALQRSAVVAERNRAEQAALLAEQEAETAERVTDFLVELFQGSDPLALQGDTVTVRGLLDRGAARVSEELAGQPAVQARLLGVLGQVYVTLGSYEEGIRLLKQAVATRVDSLEADPGVPSAHLALANAHRVAREFREAREAFRQAINSATPLAQDSVLARSHMGLGDVFAMTEELDSAEVAYGTAARLNEQWGAPEEERWDAMTRWAGLLRRRGDLDGAESLYRQVVESHRTRTDGSAQDLSVA